MTSYPLEQSYQMNIFVSIYHQYLMFSPPNSVDLELGGLGVRQMASMKKDRVCSSISDWCCSNFLE